MSGPRRRQFCAGVPRSRAAGGAQQGSLDGPWARRSRVFGFSAQRACLPAHSPHLGVEDGACRLRCHSARAPRKRPPPPLPPLIVAPEGEVGASRRLMRACAPGGKGPIIRATSEGRDSPWPKDRLGPTWPVTPERAAHAEHKAALRAQAGGAGRGCAKPAKTPGRGGGLGRRRSLSPPQRRRRRRQATASAAEVPWFLSTATAGHSTRRVASARSRMVTPSRVIWRHTRTRSHGGMQHSCSKPLPPGLRATSIDARVPYDPTKLWHGF